MEGRAFAASESLAVDVAAVSFRTVCVYLDDAALTDCPVTGQAGPEQDTSCRSMASSAVC